MSKKGTEVDIQSSSWTVKSPNPELAGYTVSYIKQQKNQKTTLLTQALCKNTNVLPE